MSGILQKIFCCKNKNRSCHRIPVTIDPTNETNKDQIDAIEHKADWAMDINYNNNKELGYTSSDLSDGEVRSSGSGSAVVHERSSTVHEEPYAIQFVETSTNYVATIEDIGDEHDHSDHECCPIGVRLNSNNNYLGCVVQMLFACRKYVRSMLDFGIHMEKPPINYFGKNLRMVLHLLNERKHQDISRYMTILQSCLDQFNYQKSIENCILSIFYKMENISLKKNERMSYVEDLTDKECTNEFEKFIVDNFYGRMSTTEICKLCGDSVSRSCQLIRMFSLITRKDAEKTTLSESIDDIFSENEFDDESKVCQCNIENHKFIKKMTLTKAPEYLIACKKDFNTKENYCSIICDKFVYIGVNMDRVKYQLIGVIEPFKGSSERCFIKIYLEEMKNSWWLISDGMVTSISDENFGHIVEESSLAFVLMKC